MPLGIAPAPAAATPAPKIAAETRAEALARIEADDLAARLSRDAAALFAAARQLGRDAAEGLLAEVRRLADEMEVEMAGGEPADDFDAGRAASYHERADIF